MSDIITIKRGATLAFSFGVTNADGSIPNLSTAVMSGAVRDAEENLIAALTPTATGTAGQAAVYVQDTSTWPLGLLRADVEVVETPGGPQLISPTFGIEVLRSETPQAWPEQAPYDPVTP